MEVRKLATMQVHTAHPDDPICEVAAMMDRQNIGFVPVVDGNHAIGVITDRDIALRVVGERRNPLAILARHIMSHPIWCVYEDDEHTYAARLMMDKRVRRIILVDHRGGYCGVLSLDDLPNALDGEHAAGRVLRRVAPSRREVEHVLK